MKTLPNGLTVFNATPHSIRFWSEGWDEPIEVETDKVVSASVEERIDGYVDCPVCGYRRGHDYDCYNRDLPEIAVVRTEFLPTVEGSEIVWRAYERGADIVVGSIIAAQAYPGRVLAMTPAPGFERVPPAEKRMRPDKFTTF